MQNDFKLYEHPPFGISFSWKNITNSIVLKNGSDVFKLQEIFEKLLKDNNIEYTKKELNGTESGKTSQTT